MGALLGRRYDDFPTGWGIGVDYHPPAPQSPLMRTRPWQKHRYERSRTAPERLYRGVWLRCLVCLRVPQALRSDQVCDACERDWRRQGRPEGIKYEYWLNDRRVNQWNKSPEHLSAYLAALVRASLSENMPSSRDGTRVSFEKWYNGSRDISDDGAQSHG